MVTVHERRAPLDDRSRGARLFRGDLIVFRSVDAVLALVSKADGTIREAFAPHDPLVAQGALTSAAFAEKSESLIGAFARSSAIRGLYRAALEGAVEDGIVTETERKILDRLREELGISPDDAAAFENEFGQ